MVERELDDIPLEALVACQSGKRGTPPMGGVYIGQIQRHAVSLLERFPGDVFAPLRGREHGASVAYHRSPLAQLGRDRGRQDNFVVVMTVPRLHLCTRDGPGRDI